MQMGKLALGLAGEPGKRRGILLHLTFFTVTAYSNALQDISPLQDFPYDAVSLPVPKVCYGADRMWCFCVFVLYLGRKTMLGFVQLSTVRILRV